MQSCRVIHIMKKENKNRFTHFQAWYEFQVVNGHLLLFSLCNIDFQFFSLLLPFLYATWKIFESLLLLFIRTLLYTYTLRLWQRVFYISVQYMIKNTMSVYKIINRRRFSWHIYFQEKPTPECNRYTNT